MLCVNAWGQLAHMRSIRQKSDFKPPDPASTYMRMWLFESTTDTQKGPHPPQCINGIEKEHKIEQPTCVESVETATCPNVDM